MAGKSILSTGHYSDENIQKEVIRIGCRFLPKFLVGQLEIKVNQSEEIREVDLVLIDDDLVTRQSWELMAKIKGKKVASFTSYEDFQVAKFSSSILVS